MGLLFAFHSATVILIVNPEVFSLDDPFNGSFDLFLSLFAFS